MDSDSFNENLDGRALAFMKTLKRRLMEAKSGHTDDMYHSREWSRTDDSVSFPCSGRTASSSSSRLVDDSCLPGIRDQSRTDVEEVAPHFVMATLICFPETQQAVRDGGSSMPTDLPLVFGTRTHPTILLARPLVATTVWGRVAKASPY